MGTLPKYVLQNFKSLCLPWLSLKKWTAAFIPKF